MQDHQALRARAIALVDRLLDLVRVDTPGDASGEIFWMASRRSLHLRLLAPGCPLLSRPSPALELERIRRCPTVFPLMDQLELADGAEVRCAPLDLAHLQNLAVPRTQPWLSRITVIQV